MQPWLNKLFGSSTTHAIRLSARFAEERHRVLANNAANLGTPDFKAQRLDQDRFQTQLREAIKEAKRNDADELRLRGDAQVSTDKAGQLRVAPANEPPDNVLFHDGTNARLETLVNDIQSNAAQYQMTLNFLKGRFDGLMTAIRGRTQ